MQRKVIQVVIAIVIVIAGVMIARHLILTRPHLKTKKRKKPIPLVKVLRVHLQKHQILVKADGETRCKHLVKVSAEVAGKVKKVSPLFEEGNLVKKGELLVKIDPRDYEASVKLAEAEVMEAKSRLAQILAESKSAIEEWKELRGNNTEIPPLVAKTPQVKAAKARLKSAIANLKKAKLNLEKTNILSPIDARVLKKDVAVGEYLLPGRVIGILCGADEIEVIAHIPEDKAKWINIPGFNTKNKGSFAIVEFNDKKWVARVLRAGGEIDPQTRLIPVLIRVKEPFKDKPPLLPGAWVRVFIKGKTLKKAVILPYSYLHQKENGKWYVWIVDKENRLRVKPVKILYMYEDRAVVQGIKDGDRIVITELEAVTPGMKVRVVK